MDLLPPIPIGVPLCFTMRDLRLRKLEHCLLEGCLQSGLRTRVPRSATAEGANHPPNAKRGNVGHGGRSALDFGFHRGNHSRDAAAVPSPRRAFGPSRVGPCEGWPRFTPVLHLFSPVGNSTSAYGLAYDKIWRIVTATLAVLHRSRRAAVTALRGGVAGSVSLGSAAGDIARGIQGDRMRAQCTRRATQVAWTGHTDPSAGRVLAEGHAGEEIYPWNAEQYANSKYEMMGCSPVVRVPAARAR